MDWIAITIALALSTTALIHGLWALGSTWPAQSEKHLARMVVGTPGVKAMPVRLVTGLVAIGIFASALLPLMWRGLIPYPHMIPQTILWLGMWALALLFLLRGAGSYLPLMNEMEQPFARLNKLYFSPLIFIIGVGFLILVLEPVW